MRPISQIKLVAKWIPIDLRAAPHCACEHREHRRRRLQYGLALEVVGRRAHRVPGVVVLVAAVARAVVSFGNKSVWYL